MINNEQAHYIGTIFGIPSFLSDFRKIKRRVGLTSKGIPVVSGSTAAQKTDSLIAALKELGLIETE